MAVNKVLFAVVLLLILGVTPSNAQAYSLIFTRESFLAGSQSSI